MGSVHVFLVVLAGWVISGWLMSFMPWIGVYHGEMDVIQWTWYFFHITSGRINTWKGVNQSKELFFLILIIIFWIYIRNWQIIGILWLKTNYFSQFITKMRSCCKILSLNDLTPSPISRPGTHCLQWQRANAHANLWWRHEPFPAKPASR